MIHTKKQQTIVSKDMIFRAVKEGNLSFLDFIRKDKSDLKVVDEDGNNILHIATMYGQIPAIKKAIDEYGIDINSKNFYGLDALKIAIVYDQKEAFKFLLNKGINPFLKDGYGNTNIHVASHFNGATPNEDKTFLELLFEYSKNYAKLVNSRNVFGNTPMHSVFNSDELSSGERVTNALTLIENGASILPNNKGETPIDLCRDPSFIEFLKVYKAPVKVH